MDTVSRARRSEIMRRIRGNGLWPERELRAELRRAGLRHRANARDLPGTPDVVVDHASIAVFVHGCFWHGCPEHYRRPKSRRAFWRAKLEANRRRDRRAARQLRAVGWSVLTVWEHDVRLDARAAADRIRRAAARRSS